MPLRQGKIPPRRTAPVPPRTALGVDIGGTLTKIGVIGAQGQVLRCLTLPTTTCGDPAPYLQELRRQLRPLIRTFQPVGLGVSLPGFLSETRSTITFNPNTPCLVGIDFQQELAELGLPLHFEQDLNAPALAEYAFGEQRGVDRLLTAAIGTGLGAAIIIRGRLLRYFGPIAGDNGHIILQPDGPACTAGCRGCAEALIAAPAIESLFRQYEHLPAAEKIQQLIATGCEVPRAVISAAASGDPLAGQIMHEIGLRLGQWLASLCPVYMPEVIILCGGVSAAGEVLRHAAEQRMRQLTGPEYARPAVRLGSFLGNAGMIGAAAPFLIDMEET